MKSYAMPIGECIYRSQKEMLSYLGNLRDFFGFIEVTVKVEKLDLPVLPHRTKDMGIIYPLGIFRGSYFSEELKLAVEQGYEILEIHSAYEYKEKAIIFNNFVDHIYKKRRNASSLILNDIYKKILNSLYGRFGLVYERTENISDNDKTSDNYIDENTKEFINQTSRTIYNNISITAAIASYARIYIYKVVSENGLDLIYLDTDGIFTKNPLPNHIVTENKELGLFRLESKNEMGLFRM